MARRWRRPRSPHHFGCAGEGGWEVAHHGASASEPPPPPVGCLRGPRRQRITGLVSCCAAAGPVLPWCWPPASSARGHDGSVVVPPAGPAPSYPPMGGYRPGRRRRQSAVPAAWFLFLSKRSLVVFLKVIARLHSAFHHGALFRGFCMGFVRGIACVIVSVIVCTAGCCMLVFSICSVYSCQWALFMLKRGLVVMGVVSCPIVMCIGKWSEQRGSGDVCQVALGVRGGDVAVMSGVVLLLRKFTAGNVGEPLLIIIKFWSSRNFENSSPFWSGMVL